MTGTGSKQLFRRAGAVVFWLAVWQCAAMAIGQEVFLVSPVQALRTLLELLPQAVSPRAMVRARPIARTFFFIISNLLFHRSGVRRPSFRLI